MTEKSVYATNPKQRPITAPKLHHATFMTLEIDPMVGGTSWSAGCSRSTTPSTPPG
ncbi:hypothetical protein [Ornithinimicrobium flavum]|uniref:hypothetical protein n=1 Tax=Ornithinimicrobium flavum TaxID=1288636 RepID=UPI0013051537|nr:hypothetical protein [Ornithinimicrobium flavum]